MALEIKVLDLGDIELDSSFLVLARNPGQRVRAPVFGMLILGADPIVVDTGYRNPQIMQRLGMRGIPTPDQGLEKHLAKYGVKLGDVRYILHTHLHIDHAGKDELFPANTTVVVNRRELEYSVSGLMGEQYPPEDIKHLVDRLHAKNGLRLLDLEISGDEEIIPGVLCQAAHAHTEGSMNILVDTAEGRACICGDIIYDVNDQLVTPMWQVGEMEPTVTGNQGVTKRAEKAGIKK
ncbi:MAG TPA: N-acyl homoserine lactonase family protein, partial [Candidatus Binataceae bacterium]|nr:N-acyl homoserine lactonase family protein [Candidatus Binataceae bacterium]